MCDEIEMIAQNESQSVREVVLTNMFSFELFICRRKFVACPKSKIEAKNLLVYSIRSGYRCFHVEFIIN